MHKQSEMWIFATFNISFAPQTPIWKIEFLQSDVTARATSEQASTLHLISIRDVTLRSNLHSSNILVFTPVTD
jgi:hypothetical protein